MTAPFNANKDEESCLMQVEPLEFMATAWSIRFSMICLFGTFLLRLLSPGKNRPVASHEEIERENLNRGEIEPATLTAARHLWLLGSFASLIHALAAMIFYHQGSHSLAFEDTARKTQILLGFRMGTGIYFNYAFVLVWMVDALWWIANPVSYQSRRRWIDWCVYGFLIFIAINGTIVFETGWLRWLSIFATITLIAIAALKWQRSSVKLQSVNTKS